MPDGPITRAELWHATEQVEKHVEMLAQRLERRIDSLSFVTRAEFDAYKEAMEGRVSANERTTTWVMRGVAGLPFIAAGAALTALVAGAL